jgi:glycyl-tRNA synthetase beta chain
MVGEFADLQGTMGRYYVLAQKTANEKEKAENHIIADAIRDHYKPQGPTDSVPNEVVAICVALADKLDTLISMFAIGEKPTGSKDRRAALGIIRIILDNQLRLPLAPLFAHIPLKEIALHKTQEKLIKQTEEKLEHPERIGKYMTVNETACSDIPEDAQDKLVQSLLEFFHDRLIVQLKEQGLRHDVIKAVIAGGDDDLVRIVNRAEALQDFLSSEDGKNLLAGYKRAANILSIEEKKDGVRYNQPADAKALVEQEERTLLSALDNAAQQLSASLKQEEYAAAMTALASLRKPVDQFFEKIMVNSDDKNLRTNRLRLLSAIREGMNALADFTQIEG